MSLFLFLACQSKTPVTHQGRAGTVPTLPDETGITDSDTTVEDSDPGTTDTGTIPDPWAGDDDTISPVQGIDISHWNGDVDWSRVAAAGITFSIAKATESDYYTDSKFPGEDDGAYQQGLIHGAYHFAIPDDSDGATQAQWFVENGGDWIPDGTTLPGTLDIEYNPYGETCYNMSNAEMAAWIADFNDEYIALTGRAPMVYSNADWWNRCVGTSDLDTVNELWVAYWSAGPPTLPHDFSTYTFWQYSATGSVDGIDSDVDMDWFPGTLHDLRDFALDR